MHRAQPATSLRQQLEQHGNDITCTCTAMGGALHVVGTQRGSVVAFAGSLGSPEGSTSASSSSAATAPLRVVYVKAAHAFAVRCIAVSAVSGLVASGSDDSSIVITPADSFCVDADSDACVVESETHEAVTPAVTSSSSSEWSARKGHTRGDTNAATAGNHPTPPRSSRRLGLCHTLPVTHVAWCQDGVTLLSSSFDGFLTVSDTNECVTLNRIRIGFPISSFCFGTPYDESFVFVVGEGVARVDLLDGSRISQPLLGTKGGTLLSSATFLGRSNNSNNNNNAEAKGLQENGGDKIASASPGVVFMQWCTGAGLEDTLTAQRCSADAATFAVPAAAGAEGNVLSQAVARYVVTRNNGRELEVLVESTAIADKINPASWTALTWNLAAERWMLAVGPYRQATSAESFLSGVGQDSTSALIAALDRMPPTNNSEGGDHHHHEKRNIKGVVPLWSLGHASWYCPPVHRQVMKASTARGGLLFLSDEAAAAPMHNSGLSSEQTGTQRKRSRTQQQQQQQPVGEASLDESAREEEAATRVRLELQATCTALAQQLKDCLAARGKK